MDINGLQVAQGFLYKGDCLEVMKDIADDSIDMVLCDLPYGVLNKTNKRAVWDSIIPLDMLWKEYRRICKENAAIILFGSGMFSADLMESNKSMWRYNLVWNKVNPTGFLNARRMPLRVHEDILVFYKKLPPYHPQMTDYDVCLRHGRGSKAFTDNNYDSTSCYGKFKPLQTFMSDKKFPVSIVTYKRKHDIKRHYHPTEKPVELLRWLIRTYSEEGDLVLDNTMGSGSTCVASISERRRFLGIEKDEKFYKTAVKRCDEEFLKLEKYKVQG